MECDTPLRFTVPTPRLSSLGYTFALRGCTMPYPNVIMPNLTNTVWCIAITPPRCARPTPHQTSLCLMPPYQHISVCRHTVAILNVTALHYTKTIPSNSILYPDETIRVVTIPQRNPVMLYRYAAVLCFTRTQPCCLYPGNTTPCSTVTRRCRTIPLHRKS